MWTLPLSPGRRLKSLYRSDSFNHICLRAVSMPNIYIEEVGQYVGQDVTIRGWLRNKRSSGKLHFLILRDGTGDLQAVVSKAVVGDESFARSATLTQESSLLVTGTIRQDARAQGGYELTRSRLSRSTSPSPSHPTERT